VVRVVRQVGVHQQNKVARRRLEPESIRSAQTELARPRPQKDAFCSVGPREPAYDVGGAVRGGVVDDDDLEVDGAVGVLRERKKRRGKGFFFEGENFKRGGKKGFATEKVFSLSKRKITASLTSLRRP